MPGGRRGFQNRLTGCYALWLVQFFPSPLPLFHKGLTALIVSILALFLNATFLRLLTISGLFLVEN